MNLRLVRKEVEEEKCKRVKEYFDASSIRFTVSKLMCGWR